MPSSPCLPARFPNGTKYVLERSGLFVRRYIEFPNGRRIQLATRKGLSCMCAASQEIGIVPDHNGALVDSPTRRLPVVA